MCVFHEDMWVYTHLHMHVKATGWYLLFFIISLHLIFWEGISQRTWLLLFQTANPGNHLIPLPPTRDCRCHAIFLFSMSARDLNSCPHSKHFTHLTGWSLFQCDSYPVENARTQAHREEMTWRPRRKQPSRAKKKDLRKTSPASTIILDSSLQREGEMNVSFYEPSGLWYLVLADKADQYSL